MLWVGSRCVVLKRLVVRNVILSFAAAAPDMARSALHRLAFLARGPESALKEPPGHAPCTEQVPDVPAGHLGGLARGAVVKPRLGIADQRPLHDRYAVAGL